MAMGTVWHGHVIENGLRMYLMQGQRHGSRTGIHVYTIIVHNVNIPPYFIDIVLVMGGFSFFQERDAIGICAVFSPCPVSTQKIP